MSTLRDDVPSWVTGYIGIPFLAHGRDRRGLDCWGLVKLIYAERFGIDLPEIITPYEPVLGNGSVMAAFVEARARWQAIEEHKWQIGDVAVISADGWPAHVGLLVGRNQLVHARPRGRQSCLGRLDAWRPTLLEVIRYVSPVIVRGTERPFGAGTIDTQRPAGESILEMLDRAGVPKTPHIRVYVGDVHVPRREWANVRPKAGRRVTVAATPLGGGGGGKSGIRIIATLAIIAAAVYTGATLAPALAGANASAGAISTWGAVVTSATGIVGTLAVNALIPPTSPRLSEGSAAQTSRSITGATNEIRPFASIPQVLGEHRVVPMLGALPYTEIVGDDQYLRLLYVLSTGPQEITDHRIGDTPLETYEGVELEVRAGHLDDAPITLYPGTVTEQQESVLLTAGAWTTRTTANDTEEISIDFTWPQGLAIVRADGGKDNRTVNVQVEYAVAGTGAWRSVNDTSPSTTREMDLLFRTSDKLRLLGSRADVITRMAWGAGFPDPKPSVLPTTRYSVRMGGYIYAEVPGEYTIGLDCSDSGDVTIKGRTVVSWYGSHATAGSPDFTSHTGTVTLTRGWHPITVRLEARSGAGAIALGWKKPGDVSFEIVPATRLRGLSDGSTDIGMAWYDTSSYAGAVSVTANRTEQIRRGLSWAVPPGQYDVRVQRTTPDATNDNQVDKVYLTAVRSINSQEPIEIKGLARVAMRIKASDQLSGTIDNYNCLARSIVNSYDPATGTWGERASSNCADLIRHIAQGRSNKRPIADSRLDLPAIEAFARTCASKGYTFNGVIDTRGTVLERLNDVARLGKATIGYVDGKISIVEDRPRTVPVQHFTPANSSGFRGRRTYSTLPHALRVGFLNAEKDYERDERVVCDDGFTWKGVDAFGVARPDLPEATIFETIEYFGCTSPDLAWKLGRYTIASAKLRPEIYELDTDCENLIASRGDMVRVTHDVPMWGAGSGRVARLLLDTASNLLGVVLDQKVTFEPGIDYSARFRLSDGTSLLLGVTGTSETDTLTFSALIAAGDPRPAAGDLWMFGPIGRESVELVIKSIEPDAQLNAKLTLVDHAPAVHLADVGAIPEFDPNITIIRDYANRPETPIIEAIRSDDLVMLRGSDGTLLPRMLISLRQVSSLRPRPTHAQVLTRPLSPAGESLPWHWHPLFPIEGSNISVMPVEEGITYEIRLRSVPQTGLASLFVDATHTIVGKSALPPDVSSITADQLSDGTRRIAWTIEQPPPDLAGVLIRYGESWQTWEQMTPLHSDPIAASPAEFVEPPAGTWRIAIKAIDTSGNHSRNALSTLVTFGAPRLEDIAYRLDCAPAWTGTLTNCSVRGGIIEANDLSTWGTLAANNVSTWAGWPRWNLSPASPITYETASLDAGGLINFAPDVDVVASDYVTVEVSTSLDGSTWTPYELLATARLRSVSARYLRARIMASSSAAVPVPTISRVVLLMRALTIVHEVQDMDTAVLIPSRRLGIGDIRVPVPSGAFAQIRSVLIGFNASGPGHTWELMDRDVVLGPRIRLYGPTGTATDAVIDAVVRGV